MNTKGGDFYTNHIFCLGNLTRGEAIPPLVLFAQKTVPYLHSFLIFPKQLSILSATKTEIWARIIQMWRHADSLGAFESASRIACILCAFGLSVVLLKRGLASRYKFLFALSVLNCIRDIVLLVFFDVTTPQYSYVWAGTLPLLMCAQAAAVLEAHEKLTNQYPGLAAFASAMLRWCVGSLALASAVASVWEFKHFTKSVLEAVLFAYRYFSFVLAGCLILPSALLCRFPKPAKRLARNVRVNLWLLICYFSVYVVGAICSNLLGFDEPTPTILSISMMIALSAIYLAWTILMTRSGEKEVPWPKLQPEIAAAIDARNKTAVKKGDELRQSWSRTIGTRK
ncbi:MAG: hypothetical protein JOY62_07145 [Acidobacteriaceae bacterium]|nr:hypothetical protein [Acidobacteriaceae bacterium]MBV9779733.1 hypothetical protein [Acidobacteriaceae bacterium]